MGLLKDPASHLTASLSNWIGPLTTEVMLNYAINLWQVASTQDPKQTVNWSDILVAPKPTEPVTESDLALARRRLESVSAFGSVEN